MGRQASKTVLMCPPEHYDIIYEINPWMDTDRPARHRVARQQWQTLYETYLGLGVEVKLIEPVAGLPDMVFTANAGLVRGQQFIVSNFRHHQRQPEAAIFGEWFGARGYQILRLPENCLFEGAGDGFFWRDVLLAGFGPRSSADSHRYIENLLGLDVVSLELVDPYFYHLDTCLCLLNEETMVYYPPAFSAESVARIKSLNANLIEVEDDEARRFACNSVPVQNKFVMNEGCRHLPKELRSLGYEPVELDLSEFIKGGGNARCLTIEI